MSQLLMICPASAIGRLPILAREYEDHYNTVRPHQGLCNVALKVVSMPGCGLPLPAEIECDSRLGGLLRFDQWVA